jgi:hypothetical protein
MWRESDGGGKGGSWWAAEVGHFVVGGIALVEIMPNCKRMRANLRHSMKILLKYPNGFCIAI